MGDRGADSALELGDCVGPVSLTARGTRLEAFENWPERDRRAL